MNTIPSVAQALSSKQPPLKSCSVCGKLFPATSMFFSPNKGGKYGLRPECKPCKNAVDAEFRKDRDLRLMRPLPIPDYVLKTPPYEIWQNIPGYAGFYQISTMGRVLSCKRNKILKPQLKHDGYLVVTLSMSGVVKYLQIHQLVMLTFVGPRLLGYEVDHINMERDDNRLINLRYLTVSQNRIERRDKGGAK